MQKKHQPILFENIAHYTCAIQNNSLPLQSGSKIITMSEVIYKIRVNRPCRLFIDDEEVAILEELKLAKFNLPEGEYLRKVMAIDNSAIYDETEITLSGASKLENITLDITGLDEAKRNALPKEAFQVGELMYQASADGKGAAVTKYVDNKLTAIVIPEQISYANYLYNVVSIGDYAFAGCYSLTSVTIPNSVTNIGEKAFCSCSSLTSITIPNSVTSIEGGAFRECSLLTSITIPSCVTNIGHKAFSYCTSLESIVIASGNTRYDSRNNCNAIIETSDNTLVAGCQNTIIPNSVMAIGDDAFRGCSQLTSITIPNSVTSIGWYAFRDCDQLISITIPNSVTSIGSEAFRACSQLTSITIPYSVTNIGEEAFCGCSSLTFVILNSDAIVSKSYDYDYHYNNSSIGDIFGSQVTEYVIGEGVTSIGDYAFAGCYSLTSVTIPNSVKSIENSAFYDCCSLTSITLNSDAIVSKSYAYDYHYNNSSIGNIFGSSVTKYVIGKSVTSIGKRAFCGCKFLTSITIPKSVTSIGEEAFCGCKFLTSITIPNSVISIGWGAFYDCSSLNSVTIPNSVTEIGENAFPEHTKVIRE